MEEIKGLGEFDRY